VRPTSAASQWNYHDGDRCQDGDAPARDDGRPDDGLQVRPEGVVRRLRQGQGSAAQEGQAGRRQGVGREVKEGLVYAYQHHNGKLGVLVEIACETDFVAKNEDFKAFCRGVALTVAAYSPPFLNRDSVPAEALDKERKIVTEMAAESMKGKPQSGDRQGRRGPPRQVLRREVPDGEAVRARRLARPSSRCAPSWSARSARTSRCVASCASSWVAETRVAEDRAAEAAG
jgi:hypothetical protein